MESYYKFGVLDPRNTVQAASTNDSLLTDNTLGIEVTIPELARRCGLGNIDPQHELGAANSPAAIEQILNIKPPPAGSTLVTVRPDLDSIACMALLELRAKSANSFPLEVSLEIIKRIKEIAVVDKFSHGDWPGQKPLPSAATSWPGGSDERMFAALGAAVSDFKVSLTERVQIMSDYLVAGTVPEKYLTQVEAERSDLIKALDSGAVTVSIDPDDNQIAIVETQHRGATTIGYSMAPIVVANNPEMKLSDGVVVRKVTICQFNDGYVDFTKLKEMLNEKEPGWGGSSTILGSPQGKSTSIPVETLLAAIKCCRKLRTSANAPVATDVSKAQDLKMDVHAAFKRAQENYKRARDQHFDMLPKVGHLSQEQLIKIAENDGWIVESETKASGPWFLRRKTEALPDGAVRMLPPQGTRNDDVLIIPKEGLTVPLRGDSPPFFSDYLVPDLRDDPFGRNNARWRNKLSDALVIEVPEVPNTAYIPLPPWAGVDPNPGTDPYNAGMPASQPLLRSDAEPLIRGYIAQLEAWLRQNSQSKER